MGMQQQRRRNCVLFESIHVFKFICRSYKQECSILSMPEDNEKKKEHKRSRVREVVWQAKALGL